MIRRRNWLLAFKSFCCKSFWLDFVNSSLKYIYSINLSVLYFIVKTKKECRSLIFDWQSKGWWIGVAKSCGIFNFANIVFLLEGNGVPIRRVSGEGLLRAKNLQGGSFWHFVNEQLCLQKWFINFSTITSSLNVHVLVHFWPFLQAFANFAN